MNTQQACCQGLSTSAARIRRTVEADIASVMPLPTASRARSVLLQRDSGIPVSASSWQASAVTSARCTGVKRGGRPVRDLLVKQRQPSSNNLS
jgi:hypothetical protein